MKTPLRQNIRMCDLGATQSQVAIIMKNLTLCRRHIATIDDDAIRDYIEILRYYNENMLTFVLMLESFYHIERTWITTHPYDKGATIPQHVVMSIRGEHSTISWNDDKISMLRLVRTITAIDADIYDVITCIGWHQMISLCMLLRDFPYREYKATRRGLLHALRRHIAHKNDISWIIQCLQWIIDTRPFIDTPMAKDWFDDKVQYPLDFFQAAYDMDNSVTIGRYMQTLTTVCDALHRRMGAIYTDTASAQFLRCDSLIEALRIQLTPVSSKTKTRRITPSNLGSWMHVVNNLVSIPDEFFIYIGRYGIDPDLNAWGIFSDIIYNRLPVSSIVKGKIVTIPSFCMEPLPSVIRSYALIATKNAESMRRWAQWMHAQQTLRDNNDTLVLLHKKDVPMVMFGNPKLHRMPKELHDWIGRGIVPDAITYDDFAELPLSQDVKDILRESID